MYHFGHHQPKDIINPCHHHNIITDNTTQSLSCIELIMYWPYFYNLPTYVIWHLLRSSLSIWLGCGMKPLSPIAFRVEGWLVEMWYNSDEIWAVLHLQWGIKNPDVCTARYIHISYCGNEWHVIHTFHMMVQWYAYFHDMPDEDMSSALIMHWLRVKMTELGP